MVQNNRLGLLTRWVAITLLMTITANGWRVVFKVSKNGDVAPAESLYQLWDSSDVVNDHPSGFHNTNLTYMAPYQPTYKSEIVNKWQEYDIQYVKVGLYSSGKEVAAIVFNGTSTNKTTWFESNEILLSSYEDIRTNYDYPFSLQGSYSVGRFQALSSNTSICLDAIGWFTVVDKDIRSYCGNRTVDTPYFLYASGTKSMKLIDGGVADSFAVFVDDCVVNPCQYHGTCTSRIDGRTCHCVDQVYGDSCQYECPCLNRGFCHAINNSHIQNDGSVVISGELINHDYITLDSNTKVACKCPEYHIGANCSIITLQCASSPCLNFGTCVEGYTYFTCKCTEDYMGSRCEVPRPAPKHEGMNTGAKVAIGICIPLAIVIALVMVYIIYMFKHPEAYGHEATMKKYTIAREFVRRSIRRMSGRRTKRSDDTKDTSAISPKEKEVSVGQVNLGFDDGGKASYARQNSEYYNLSADDNAVVSGQSNKYPTDNKYLAPYSRGQNLTNPYQNTQLQQSGQHRIPSINSRENTPVDNRNEQAFYNEYRPAGLHGSNNDRYTHPGHRYDEYSRKDLTEEPIPQPRTQRQTGRRGRQGNASQSNEPTTSQMPSKNTQSNMPYANNLANAPTRENDVYIKQISDSTSRSGNNYSPHTDQLPSPRYESSRLDDKYKTSKGSDGSYTPHSADDRRLHSESRLSPGYGPPQNIHDRSVNDSRFPSGHRTAHVHDRSPVDPRYSPGYSSNQNNPDRTKEDQRPGYSQPHHANYISQNNEYISPGYRGEREINQRSPRLPSDYNPYTGTHDGRQGDYRSDEGIVFTSSEPMDDVTV